LRRRRESTALTVRWTPVSSVCLTLVSSLQAEKIPVETFTIYHRTRSGVGNALPSRADDLPFHLSFHWCHAPQSRTGICYITHDAAGENSMIITVLVRLFYCPWNALCVPETCPSRFDCDWRRALHSRCRFTSATDNVTFPREMQHNLRVVFPMRARLLLSYAGDQSSGKDDTS